MKFDVVYATDKEFFFPFLVSVYSLLRHSDVKELHVHLLYSQLSRNEIRIAEGLIEKFNGKFYGHQILSQKFATNQKATVKSTATCFRYLIPKLLNGERAVYIDSDTLILGSIKKLFALPLDNYYIAGVQDGFVMKDIQHIRSLFGNTSDSGYINAGVLALNLLRLRNEFVDSKMLDLDAISEFKYRDQDVINVCCRGKILFISDKWNVTSDKIGGVPIEVIRHFTGFEKPWILPAWNKKAETYWKCISDLIKEGVAPLDFFDWIPIISARTYLAEMKNADIYLAFLGLNSIEGVCDNKDFVCLRLKIADDREKFIEDVFSLRSVIYSIKSKNWKKFLSVVYSWASLIGFSPKKRLPACGWSLFKKIVVRPF